jgi:ATP-dependent Clp protease ATP-binding subunit ClpA
MFEKMTPRLKAAMAQASLGAIRAGRGEVGPDELLWGLLRAGPGAADVLLETQNVDVAELGRQVHRTVVGEARCGCGGEEDCCTDPNEQVPEQCRPGCACMPPLPPSDSGRATIDEAVRRARTFGRTVSTAHLLAGLLEIAPDVAGGALGEFGLSAAALDAGLASLSDGTGEAEDRFRPDESIRLLQ